MKNQKLLLSDEEEDDLTLGLVRLSKEIPDYELFFNINSCNESKFSRIKDLKKTGQYFDYYHPRFETYHFETKSCIQFIANKSASFLEKTKQTELFSEEIDINYLLPLYQEVDYIIKTSDIIPDFSLILLPENLMFHIQDFYLSSTEELYQLIQYYE